MDNQEPTFVLEPHHVKTYASQIIRLGKTVGINLDPWQKRCLELFTGADAEGKFVASTHLLTVARQNGKSEIAILLILAGILLFDDQVVVYSSHASATSQEIFRRVKNIVEASPSLSKRVTKIFSATAREYIQFGTQLVKFVVRTRTATRGLSVDRLIIDEAQELSEEAYAALRFTIAARPKAVMTFMGSVPGPLDNGEVFTRIHDLAQKGSERLAAAEWCAAPGADLDDPLVHRRVNPAYGIRISAETVADERGTSSDETFSRERLSIWAVLGGVEVIPTAVWKRQELEVSDPLAEIVENRSIGIDTTGDRSTTSVSVAGKNVQGDFVVSLIEQFSNPDAAVKFVRDLAAKNELRAIVVDAKSQAGTLLDKFKAEGLRPTVTSDKDMAAACGNLFDGFTDGWAFHIGQVQFTQSLQQARKRPIGDAWGWNRKTSSSDISPLVAGTLALFGAMNSKVKRPIRSSANIDKPSRSPQKMIVLQ